MSASLAPFVCGPRSCLCVSHAQPDRACGLNVMAQWLPAAISGAKKTALGYVQTGKSPEYVPCYWAGYADKPDCPTGWRCGGNAPHWDSKGLHGSNIGQGRRAFYLRDMAHHALGAHLLGLDNEVAFATCLSS
jgi:hypothetical protein